MSGGVPRNPRRHTAGELAEAVNEIQCDTKQLLASHTQLDQVVRLSLQTQKQTNARLEQMAAENRQLVLELHADHEQRMRQCENDQALKARLGCEQVAKQVGQNKSRLAWVIGILVGAGVISGGTVTVLKMVGVL